MKFGLIVIGIFLNISVLSVNAWDIAVAVQNEINFLNMSGGVEGRLSRGLEEVEALVYNAELGQMYFVDNERFDGTIFQVTVPKNLSVENSAPEVRVVVSKLSQKVKGLAYDDMTGVLYYTTVVRNPAIMFVKVNLTGGPQVGQRLLSLPGQSPVSLSIDTCKRYLYWSNTAYKKGSLERLKLDSSGERTTIVSKDVTTPNAVVVDQNAEQLYWIDQRIGGEFRIESSDLEGNNRRILYSGTNHEPYAVALSSGSVIWTDHIQKSVWRLELNPTTIHSPVPHLMVSYTSSPEALVSAHIGRQKSDRHCNTLVDLEMVVIPAIVTRITPSTEQPFATSVAGLNVTQQTCLHNGSWRESYCICPPSYSGIYCEVDECLNYCLHDGSCIRHNQGKKCACTEGHSGVRCEESVCQNYCIFGHCSVDLEGQPQCHCQEGYTGQRCEVNYTEEQRLQHDLVEACHAFCRLWAQSEKDTIQPFEVCRCSQVDEVASLESDWGRDHILLGLLVLCVILILLTAVLMRKVMVLRKRPRVKKRIIVNKSVTPLTCRPSQSDGEQCEITIENCCNMNICETPCFEPDFRQPSATLSRQNNKGIKEEKKTLLGSMELPPDDLY